MELLETDLSRLAVVARVKETTEATNIEENSMKIPKDTIISTKVIPLSPRLTRRTWLRSNDARLRLPMAFPPFAFIQIALSSFGSISRDVAYTQVFVEPPTSGQVTATITRSIGIY